MAVAFKVVKSIENNKLAIFVGGFWEEDDGT
jgi:hypothetical protein